MCKEKNFDLIIPLSDFSANIFAKEKSFIESNSKTKVAVNDLNTFLKAADKLNTMLVCMDNDIPCPYTLNSINSICDVPADLKYPVVVKPRCSCGSLGLHIAQNRNELSLFIDKIHEEGLGEVLVQEFIPQSGRQFNAHFLLDENHNVKTSVLAEKCRWFPLDGGASTLCRTVHNSKIISECEKLLKIIGWKGYCDIDLMEDPRDGSIRVIEINARISANIQLCFDAGVNIIEQLIQLYSGDNVTAYLEYKDDVRLRCIQTDLLWLLKSHNRFKADPSWFSLKRTYDQIGAWDDIMPFIFFCLTAPIKYKKEMKKRER